MKTILTSALVIATLGGTAFAGDQQWARLADIDTAKYSINELTRINEALRENNSEELRFVLSGDSRKSFGSEVTPATAQLAELAGVEPGEYTPAELTRIVEARRDGDVQELNYLLSHANRSDVGSSVKSTPGRVQLARIAGLDASTATLAEIVEAQPSMGD